MTYILLYTLCIFKIYLNKIKKNSHIQLFNVFFMYVSMYVAHQASLSMEFSRQKYQSGLPFPSPGDLPNSGIKPRFLALQTDSLQSEPPGKPMYMLKYKTLLGNKYSKFMIVAVSDRSPHRIGFGLGIRRMLPLLQQSLKASCYVRSTGSSAVKQLISPPMSDLVKGKKRKRGEQKDIRLVFLQFSSPCFHCLLRVASRNVRYVEDRLQFPVSWSSQKLPSTNLKHGCNKVDMVDPLAQLKPTLLFLLPKRLLIPIWCES